MGDSIIKKCNRCGTKIECKVYEIKNCKCSEISLTPDEIRFIHSKYSDCLCNKCLMQMKEEYKLGT
jgi:hypothetical protein